MGFDANIKSAKSERKQRLIIVVSLVALSAACFLLVSLLQPPKISSVARKNDNGKANAAARTASLMASKKQGAKLLRAGDTKAAKSVAVTSDADKHKQPPKPKQAPAVAVVAPAAASSASASQKSEKELATIRADLEEQVRAIKATGVIMEADPHSLEYTGKLQQATRDLLKIRYGDYGTQNYRVKFDLEFQSTIPDFESKGAKGSLLVEMGPISLIPCSVYNFLEIARSWKKGAFHRNAGHVLQAISRSAITKSMPFQEYHKEYPHKKGTLGYAGRPSGPEFYVSIQDNTRAHGPGSQQQHNKYEADVIIGTLIRGMEDGTVDRIHTMPGKEFMGDKKKWVLIRRMHILVPGDGGGGNGGEEEDGYVEFSMSPEVIPED